jgi:hypothetical protein
VNHDWPQNRNGCSKWIRPPRHAGCGRRPAASVNFIPMVRRMLCRNSTPVVSTWFCRPPKRMSRKSLRKAGLRPDMQSVRYEPFFANACWNRIVQRLRIERWKGSRFYPTNTVRRQFAPAVSTDDAASLVRLASVPLPPTLRDCHTTLHRPGHSNRPRPRSPVTHPPGRK